MSNILDRTGQLTAGFVQVDIVARFRPRYALFSSLSSIVKLSKGRTPGRSVELTPPDIHSTTTTAAQFPINNPPARPEEAAAAGEAVPAATGLGTRTAAGPAASLCGMRQYTSCHCSTPTPWGVSLTLLRGSIAGHIGRVSSAVRLSVLGRHSVLLLLLRRTVGHALHGRATIRAATAVATTAIASGAAAAATASSRTSVRGLVDADGASIKSR